MGLETRSQLLYYDRSKLRKTGEGPLVRAGRAEVIHAGTFLESSGLYDAILRFRESILRKSSLGPGAAVEEIHGELSSDTLRNEKSSGAVGVKVQARAGIVFEWKEAADPKPDLYKLHVTAARNYRDRVLAGSVIKSDQDDKPLSVYVVRHFFERGFSFNDPVSDTDKLFYLNWLRNVFLNSGVDFDLGSIDLASLHT